MGARRDRQRRNRRGGGGGFCALIGSGQNRHHTHTRNTHTEHGTTHHTRAHTHAHKQRHPTTGTTALHRQYHHFHRSRHELRRQQLSNSWEPGSLGPLSAYTGFEPLGALTPLNATPPSPSAAPSLAHLPHCAKQDPRAAAELTTRGAALLKAEGVAVNTPRLPPPRLPPPPPGAISAALAEADEVPPARST